MITELTRLWSAWLKHPEHGVNAWLEAVPRRRLDATEDPAPQPVAIYDDVDTEALVLNLDPPIVPALVCWVDTDADVNAMDPHYRKTGEPVIVAFAYITRDVPAVQAKLDGGYTLRALRRTVRLMNDQQKSLGYRELNGIKILNVATVSTQVVAGGVGKSEMWGLLYASVNVVDTLA